MGYTTYFNGSLEFNKPVAKWLIDYINKFSETRRMKRDVEKIKQQFPNWPELCFNGDLGVDGEYFIGGTGYFGQENDDSVIDHNRPPETQPGLWCQWVVTETELMWDEGEKFYSYEEWLYYLIEHFFEPLGYKLNGEITWEGEDSDDFGTIKVVENDINMQYGIHIISLDALDTDDLVTEIERRGYTVIKKEM